MLPTTELLVSAVRPLLPARFKVVLTDDLGERPIPRGLTMPEGFATVQFQVSPSAGIRVTTQILQGPIAAEAILHGENDRVETWPSGSEVALVDRLNSTVVQVVVVRPLGLMINLNSHGMPGRGVPPPLNPAELVGIARQLDTDEVEAVLLSGSPSA